MREIKFQAWDLDAEQMYNWESIRQHFHEYLDHPRVKVRQYTGLKDINGREIYKGDVYHQGDPNILYVVEYKGASFVGKQIGSSSYAGLEHWKGRIEVIGDVYRNPELLEAAE